MVIAISLHDYPAGNVDAVAQAVIRFRRQPRRKLGDDTHPALNALENVSESSANDLTKEELRIATDYAAAYKAADTAGFCDLSDGQDACFDVRLA